MAHFKDISTIVPLPVVDLHNIARPAAGLFMPVPDACDKNFGHSERCRKHYEALSGNIYSDDIVPCPFGFASRIIATKGVAAAMTGFVPYPRLGGEAERRMAKKFPSSKISAESVEAAVEATKAAIRQLDAVEQSAIKKHSMALHEIRKLNRTVKQAAERLCNIESPANPHAANTQLVQIWKSSELMSRQFDVIEILANESLITLPLNSVSEVYRIFDKCVRIYTPATGPNRLLLRAASGYSGRIRACDKTLSIIPSVLIENALKYSVPGTQITIDVSPSNGECVVEVRNDAKKVARLDQSVFQKGVRKSTDKDGSGNGLYLAKLVAEQHGGEIELRTRPIDKETVECAFIVSLPEYEGW